MKCIYPTKYEYPNYDLKRDFTPGTFSENEWMLGETACVERCYYSLPNGSEYAIFKFAERRRTGGKKFRWEVYHNGRFFNNYFTCFDDAVNCVENEMAFHGYGNNLSKYRIKSVYVD